MIFTTARFASAGLLALSACWSVAAHEYSSNSTACTRSYRVVDGDTCDKIGQKTLTSTYQILAFNLPQAGETCETLEIGATLCLGRYGNDCQAVHRVTGGDTCYSIAANYKIPLSLLEDNNPSMDCNQIYDGLVLCVAPGVMRPPPVDALNAAIQAQRNNGAAASRKRSQAAVDGQTAESHLVESTGVKEEERELQVDREKIEALQAKMAHAGGAARHGRGIHAPVLNHQRHS